jgi:hypothetical protein
MKLIVIKEHYSSTKLVTSTQASLMTMFTTLVLGFVTCNINNLPPNQNATFESMCHNLSLGFVTKVRVCKGSGPRGSLRVTFHAPGSVKECGE